MTLDDITTSLAGTGLDGDHLDRLLFVLEEADISVVRKAKPRPPRSGAPEEGPARVTRARRRGVAKRRREGDESSEGHSADPVRVYLREMGQVSLLTREGEVVIARRIEAGIHQQELAILGNAYGAAHALAIGDLVRKGKLDLRHAVDGMEEETDDPPADRRKQFLSALSRVKRVESEIQRKQAASEQSDSLREQIDAG